MSVSFKELRRAAKDFVPGSFRIAITGDCATQFLATCVKGALARANITGELFEADYDQVARQLLTTDSELRLFSPEVVVVWETVEHWWEMGGSVEKRLRAVSEYATGFSGKIFYVNAAPFRDGVFGSNPCGGRSFPAQVREFNAGLDVLVKKHSNLFLIDLNSIVSEFGRQQACEPTSYFIADMPIVPDVQAILAQTIVDVVCSLRGHVKKCVVVDLDNTLWGGVIGEDGVGGIRIAAHGTGKEFWNFQKFLKRLKDRGLLLAICSKNDESVAKEAFEKHPDMILRLDDFVCFVANWNNKADNVSFIQHRLNIGLDSFVFIDDNPVERGIVRMAHPQVAVPEMPADPSCWVDYLIKQNYFEAVVFSEGDAQRTQQYRSEVLRQDYSTTFKDESSFLAGLEMHATVKRLDAFTIPRAAQLSLRSNQFNLRTVRYAESELSTLVSNPAVLPLGFELSDRFGSHGLICVLIGKMISEEEMFIDTWLMSCRVLKRGMEVYVLNCIVRQALLMGAKRLVGEYVPTQKNGLVRDLYPGLGFERLSNGRFVLDLIAYKEKECLING